MRPRGGFSHPERVIEELHIPEGARVADFGAGSGYFTIEMAKLVGPDGSVTAVDVLPTALEVIKSKATDRGLLNISYVRGNLEVEEGSGLAENSQDLVLLANILFQSQKKADVLKEARRVLKDGGRLVIIDWLPEAGFGPGDKGWKFSANEAREIAESESLKFKKEIHASTNHWGLLFEK